MTDLRWSERNGRIVEDVLFDATHATFPPPYGCITHAPVPSFLRFPWPVILVTHYSSGRKRVRMKDTGRDGFFTPAHRHPGLQQGLQLPLVVPSALLPFLATAGYVAVEL